MYGACGGEDAATEFRYSLGLDSTKVQTVALEYLYFARYAQEGEQSSEWLWQERQCFHLSLTSTVVFSHRLWHLTTQNCDFK
jgi:hypothetical protein